MHFPRTAVKHSGIKPEDQINKTIFYRLFSELPYFSLSLLLKITLYKITQHFMGHLTMYYAFLHVLLCISLFNSLNNPMC